MTDMDIDDMRVLTGAKQNTVVIPGDVLGAISNGSLDKVQLGPGLQLKNLNVIVCRPGVLRYRAPNRYWVDSNFKRYVPIKEERVIGVVTDRLGEGYKVDIGSAHAATLDSLAFEGVTKRNRPNLTPGSLVYGRLSVADRNMEPQLVCVDGNLKANGMGVLIGGHIITCSLGLVRQLLASNCTVLSVLSKYIPFEIAVGMNGRVWIMAHNMDNILVVTNGILNSEFMTDAQVKTMVQKLVEQL